MGLEHLSRWLAAATQTTSPLALTLVHLRAHQLGNLLESGKADGMSERLCDPKGMSVMAGLQELKDGIDRADPALMASLLRGLEETPDVNAGLVADAVRLRVMLTGGDTRPLRQTVASLANFFLKQAEVQHEQGRLDEAEHFYMRSLSFAQASLPAGHVFFRLILSDLAALHFSRGELDRSEFLCRRSLKVTEKTLGQAHPDYGRGLVNLASIYEAKKEAKISRKLLTRALPILRGALGPNHAEVLGVSKKIGSGLSSR